MADEKPGLTAQTVEWLKGQPFNNVLLLGLLSVVVYGGYLAVTDAIPAHLKQIQAGYQSLEDRNLSAMQDLDAKHREQVTELRTTFDKTLDRYERIWSDKFNDKIEGGRRTTLIAPNPE